MMYVNFQKLLHVTDVLLFGRILYCGKCQRGSFILRNGAYKCYGFESEWAECDNIVVEPKRRPAFIPASLRNKHKFLQRYFGIRTRLIEHSPANEMVQVRQYRKLLHWNYEVEGEKKNDNKEILCCFVISGPFRS